jgi:hypothetical protein
VGIRPELKPSAFALTDHGIPNARKLRAESTAGDAGPST